MEERSFLSIIENLYFKDKCNSKNYGREQLEKRTKV